MVYLKDRVCKISLLRPKPIYIYIFFKKNLLPQREESINVVTEPLFTQYIDFLVREKQ